MDANPDKLERRCPRLGGQITFQYCRENGEGEMPCWKIFDCWWEIFDVTAYLQTCYPPEVLRKLAAARPKPKVASLVEMIAEAKKRCGQ